jgi:alpha-glucosidase
LEISLDFLDLDRPYVAEIYADGPDADWEENPHSYAITITIVTADTVLDVRLAPGGGGAIRLRPATEADVSSFDSSD